MQSQARLLVASERPENNQAMSKILDNFRANDLTVRTLAEVRQVLSAQPISVIFCYERVSDGLTKTCWRSQTPNKKPFNS